MRHVLRTLIASLALCATAQATPKQIAAGSGLSAEARAAYQAVINQVVAMPRDRDLQRRARALGLNVVNVMWEDTGRAAGSAFGPNISDLTLQVHDGQRSHLLPVIRHPNFSDKTADVPADSLWIKVGNAKGEGLKALPLADVLGDLKAHLHDPASLLGDGDLTATRDTHYLVSAQHVFVPLAQTGKADFNPVLFNYQSAPESPAVLTLLVTREGTSATVIENRKGDQSHQSWGQQLFFNDNGQRTRFTAERLSAVVNRIESGQGTAADKTANDPGADMMLIVQVPLKHKNKGLLIDGLAEAEGAPGVMMGGGGMARTRSARSNVEAAVIGHGDALGPFTEMNGLKLERDDRFPVRVTVQFYKATSNGVVDEADLKAAHAQIQDVYEKGDYVGSLVVPEGERVRPTDWIKDDPNGGAWSPYFQWHAWIAQQAGPKQIAR